jgi:ATP-binding cassette subfamily B protein
MRSSNTAKIDLDGDLPEVTYATKTASDRLNELVADHLTFHYPNSTNGIEDISLKIKRGSLTVITGRIGSGKTTLLRTLLGCSPLDSGEIRWNGQHTHT